MMNRSPCQLGRGITMYIVLSSLQLLCLGKHLTILVYESLSILSKNYKGLSDAWPHRGIAQEEQSSISSQTTTQLLVLCAV